MKEDWRYILGIDLGTTNSALAFADTQGSKNNQEPKTFAVSQLVAQGTVAKQSLLPSALYLPAEHEFSEGALKLPWGEPPFVVGAFAREQGALVSGRLVASAKSWLSHGGVDRTAAILPWGAAAEVKRLSPVEASRHFLEHLAAAWNQEHPDHPLSEQEIVLTVPASFDEAARELTLEAAEQAGLGQPTLLEEPLAAFYHWLSQHEQSLEEAVKDLSLVLVVDVGGGTTDLTLIQVRHEADGPVLNRIAVGDHLLLGGDNIDLALARMLEKRLGSESLDQATFGALVEAAQAAKVALLAPDAPAERRVSVAGRSSRLLGGAKSAVLTRDEVRELIWEGFLPLVPADAQPARRTGLRSAGLPYASDPAITRHIAAFCQRHLAEGQRIDGLLINGGTLFPSLLTERLLDVLESWNQLRPRLLANDALDLAVAKGAAFYGLSKRKEGIRVGAGSARAYFLGVESGEGEKASESSDASKSADPATSPDSPDAAERKEGEKDAEAEAAGGTAVCVVPRGLPEGEVVTLGERKFSLTVGVPVRFEVFSSTGRRRAKAGDLISTNADDLNRLPPLQTVIRSEEAGGASEIEVHLEAGMTEIGTLALFCVGKGKRYKLEFQLRSTVGEGAVYETASLPRRFEEGRALIDSFYGRKPASDVDPREVRNLLRELERMLGERSTWSLPMLRELWSALWAGAQKRRRSPEHERMWMRLAGYTLRPGFGAPLDEWRAQQTFSIFPQGLQFHKEPGAWDQWWILWRRIAGGLDEASQMEIVDILRPWLRPVTPGRTAPRPKGPRLDGFEEMIRLVASLERLPVETKLEVGEWLWSRLGQATAGGSSWWTVGRLGSRVPFYGSAHQVLPPDVAEEWLERLLKLNWKKSEGAAFAATSLARLTDDRTRDVSEATRKTVLSRLKAMKASPAWIQVVQEAVVLDEQDEQRMFGESLPVGLKLVR